jgi:hypothetical protein
MAKNVTNNSSQADWRVVRAARSLDINQRNKKIVTGRIDRASYDKARSAWNQPVRSSYGSCPGCPYMVRPLRREHARR